MFKIRCAMKMLLEARSTVRKSVKDPGRGSSLALSAPSDEPTSLGESF